LVKHHIALGLAKAHSTADIPHVEGGIDIAKGRPVDPVTLVRPHAAARAARFFVEKFPGRSMYAVKANPSPELLQILWDNGITHYDVASIAEVRLVARTLPEATLCFMHPVKAEEAVREAYFTHGVRTFSLDSLEELDKVVRATNEATDLTLCVRLRVSSEHSKLSLASKFGAAPHEAKELLFAARQAADALGICFHVGSQAMTPEAYSNAMERVRAAIVEAAVFETIHRAFESLPVSYSSELWCEPGRALCAEYSSLIVRVEKRRGTELFINDGAYGALFDAAHIGWRFPVELLREPDSRAKDMEFSFYGPTCDDMDHMAGPFMLPADTQAGDYIEIGMLGAYGSAMRTAFNGFGSDETVIVTDEPMVSLYDERFQDLASNVVKL
jgi:ornithine decarboxylase